MITHHSILFEGSLLRVRVSTTEVVLGFLIGFPFSFAALEYPAAISRYTYERYAEYSNEYHLTMNEHHTHIKHTKAK